MIWQAHAARLCASLLRRPVTPGSSTGNRYVGVKRGWAQQVGVIKTTLVFAIAVTASNLRRLLTWSRATGVMAGTRSWTLA